MLISNANLINPFKRHFKIIAMSGVNTPEVAKYASMLTPHEYTISGVKVMFPMKAYPSQVAMMANGCNKVKVQYLVNNLSSNLTTTVDKLTIYIIPKGEVHRQL